MIARLVQFLYAGTYDVHYFEACGNAPTLECTLATVLNDRKRQSEQGFASDKERDAQRSELEIHLMMCGIAIKYEMPRLTDHALHRAFHCHKGEDHAEEVVTIAYAVLGTPIINRDDNSRKLFADYIAHNRKKIKEDTLRNWLRGDGTFAIEMMDCLLQRISELQQQATLLEEPPNLKKRRPSFDDLSEWTPPQTNECEMVTTPILVNRNIIEQRRSNTEG